MKKRERKSKNTSTEILIHEDSLVKLAADLRISSVNDELKTVDAHCFSKPPTCLRLPLRRLENGHYIQRRVRKQLRFRMNEFAVEDFSEDELQQSQEDRRIHPALSTTYHNIPSSLTAYDRAECENRSWAQKYAPQKADQVLQAGQEANILRDWMSALTVAAVQNGANEKAVRLPRKGAGSKSEGQKKKKKRKSDKLDGFVVSSDEEVKLLDEVSESEDNLTGQTNGKKTLVRGGNAWSSLSKTPGRPANVVIISGPHGCGKTATVYAAAKELDFEVFEINSGSRRSGKDIMDRVGDLAQNHIVDRVQKSRSGNSHEQDVQRVSDAFEKDLKSGRQGTMKAFLQPKNKPKTNGKQTIAKTDSKQSKVTEPAAPSSKSISQNTINAFFKVKPGTEKKELAEATSTNEKTLIEAIAVPLDGATDSAQIKKAPSRNKTMESFFTNGKPKMTEKHDKTETKAGDAQDVQLESKIPASSSHENAGDCAEEGLSEPKSDATPSITKHSTAPPKSQKQSLILLEEADVLFDEDKQFWPTILALAIQSKRPIILTCTDESLIPIQALPLHAIIRCSPPPIDIAVDYLLLVAAAEGHLLERKAVQMLYESRDLQLRASLTELDFWCQIGIGDRKGGLEWLYPRWPRGSDLDATNNVIRVVSDGTYRRGMGWLSSDHLKDRNDASVAEEELVREARDDWALDIGDWMKFTKPSEMIPELPCDIKASKKVTLERLRILERYDMAANYISVSDICDGGGYRHGIQAILDPDHPRIPAKSMDDYIIGHELLQVQPLVQYSSMAADLSAWLKSLSRQEIARIFGEDATSTFKKNGPTEQNIYDEIIDSRRKISEGLNRNDFSAAFDPISESEKISSFAPNSLEISTFDRPLSLIAEDVAPYVRAIVTSDAKIQAERLRLSSLMSLGGRSGKRIRTTRAAMSALEGGNRTTTRKDKYFDNDINPNLVLKTGLKSWQDALSDLESGWTFSGSSTAGSLNDSADDRLS